MKALVFTWDEKPLLRFSSSDPYFLDAIYEDYKTVVRAYDPYSISTKAYYGRDGNYTIIKDELKNNILYVYVASVL